jgi:uncharacterized protein YraI
MSRRRWALVAMLVLINYIIFGLLAIVVFGNRDRVTQPTRTPMPTFSPMPSPTPLALVPTSTPPPMASPTPTLAQETAPIGTAVAPPRLDTPAPIEAPSETSPSASATTDSGGPSVTVDVSLNVRAGPGTNYERVGSLAPGSSADIVGRNADGSWWQILYPGAPGDKAWISASYGTAGNTEGVPVVEVPPAPTAAPTSPPAPVPTETPGWQYEPTGFEGQWNAGLAQIRGHVQDGNGDPANGVFIQAKCGGTVLASNPTGINLYAPGEPYEAGAYDIILSSPLSPESMCNWEVRVVDAATFEEAQNPGAPSLSDSAYCDLEWEVASICFTRWRKNW